MEAPSKELKITSTEIPDSVPMMFVVSGKSQEALLQYLNNYLDFCLDADASLFHSICYTSCVGREHYRYRFACVATNMQDLIARLEERIRVGLPVSAGNARRILMGFPGQGSQYQGMGRYLAQQYSGFNTIITDAANKASALTGYPILPFLIDQSAPRGFSIDQSEIAQICIFIFQYSVCTWLESLGVHAHAVMGHSLGEIAAAGMFISHVAGSLLIDSISDCSGFQFRGWFAVRGCQGHPSPRQSCPPWRYGCCRSVGRESCKIYIQVGYRRSCRYRCLQWPRKSRRIWRDESH